jgi:hypothetical protein
MIRDPKFWTYIAVAAALAFLVGALAGGVAKADYSGSRWRNDTICLQVVVHDPAIRQQVVNAAHNYDASTRLRVHAFGSSSCAASGYTQVIKVVDNAYGTTGWVGTTYFGGWDWGQTPRGKWTWLNRPGVEIRLNQSYANSGPGWRHVILHELGHALGLDHVTDTCDSVMSQRSGCPWRSSLYPRDIGGTTDLPGINRIYSW